MTLLIVIGATLAASLFSLLGGLLLLSKKIDKNKIMLYAMPFGAGALLGAAFFTVLPEVVELSQPAAVHQEHQPQEHNEEASLDKEHDEKAHEEENHEGSNALSKESSHSEESDEKGIYGSSIFTWVLIGFVIFFILERSIRWFHRHHEHAGAKSQRSLIVLGDTLHNAIDGVAIGAAFAVNVPLGIATTIAVAAHELPQEIGDFGLLLSRGMKRKNVLLINIISGLAAVVTAAVTFILAGALSAIVAPLLAIVAGVFIYIAAADIIPEIHEQPLRRANIQTVFLGLGIVLILFTGITLELLGIGHSH